MKKITNRILNIMLIVFVSLFAITSCANTGGIVSQIPPITVVGKWQGKPIEVTVYPDGSKPTEVKIDGLTDGPIVIDTTKKQ